MTSLPREINHFGEGITRVVLWPPWKTCKRSIVFGEADAGTAGGGRCETMVVRRVALFNVVDNAVGVERCPGTDE